MLFDAISNIRNINLSQLNLWLDIIQVALIAGAAGAVVFLLGVNVVTGRFRRTWLEKDWWYVDHLHEPWHEEFPMPTRIWHWINICSFVVFFATGFYIRYPFIAGGREIARYLHYIGIYAASGAWIYRWGWFMTTTGDWRTFLKIDLKKDLPNALEAVKFYLGIRYEYYSHVAKYWIGQRLGYASLMLIVFPIQAYTGFSLIWPKTLLAPFVGMGIFADFAVAAAWARFIHAVIMRIYFAFFILHAGLAFVHYFPNFLYFWLGIAWPQPHLEHGHGHDDHGEGHGDGHAHDEADKGHDKKDEKKKH